MPINELSSITGLITAAGSVIGLANKANSVEANQKIIELRSLQPFARFAPNISVEDG
jgi:hypothetical protein